MVNNRALVVGLALACAVVVGGTFAYLQLDDFSNNSIDEQSQSKVGVLVRSDGPACLEKAMKKGGGWVEIYTFEGQPAVQINTTVVHERNETVSAGLRLVDEGVYELSVNTSPTSEEETDNPLPVESATCTVGTHLHASGQLMSNPKEVNIIINGEKIQTVESSAELPKRVDIPHPYNTTKTDST